MKNRLFYGIFALTSGQKTLDCLARDPEKEFTGAQIAKAAGISRQGAYLALKELAEQGLIYKIQKGGAYFYSAAAGNPVFKQFKVLKSITELAVFVEKIKVSSKKIIMYGSASRGENTAQSDYDIFVITGNVEGAKSAVKNVKSGLNLQVLIKTPLEWELIKEKDRVYYNEVDRGIVLWEELR